MHAQAVKNASQDYSLLQNEVDADEEQEANHVVVGASSRKIDSQRAKHPQIHVELSSIFD